jgi:uroporphyrinogen-III synthase
VTTLAGRRILITREADDSRRWAHRLAATGAVPIVFPCLVCEPIADPDMARRLRAAIADADWLVVSSVRGVEAAAQLLDGSLPFATIRVAAVGPSTAVAATMNFGHVDLVARRATGAALGADLAGRLAGTDQRVLVLGAEGGRTDVEAALSAAGVAWTRIDVYRTNPLPPAAEPRDFAAEGVQDILLASPTAVSGLRNAAVIPAGARIITIGPTTTSAARDAGLTVWAEARQPSLEGMLEAIQ